MAHSDFTFKLVRKVDVDVDFHRHQAVISCESPEGEKIKLMVDFQTLEEIHAKIQQGLDTIHS